MEPVKVLYIDDHIDLYVSRYLSNKYKFYQELTFDMGSTYESLLREEKVHWAEIIVIDSVLFENAYQKNQKMKGEEFKLILRRVSPFKEVIVVTQNEIPDGYKFLKKFEASAYGPEDEDNFFENEWKPTLDQATDCIILCRKVFQSIETKNYVDDYLMQSIQQSLEGKDEYDGLTVTDIDNIVEAFEEVKKAYANR